MKRLVLIVLSLFFLTTPALARDSKADMWIVSQRSGDARVVHRGIQPASLKVRSALAPGDVVVTGASGRATLARGSDYIVIAPHSELRLPAGTQARGFTRVVQQLGTMLFKVKHTGAPHFAVDTPMLAAVVKGTTFTIIVDRDRSAVQVVEGAVQVTATQGGMQKLVEGGNTVFIDRNNPTQLITADAQTLGATQSTETAIKLTGSEGESVAAVADLTGGLVQAEVIMVAAKASPALTGALVAPTAPTDSSGSPVQPAPGTTVDPATGVVKPITEPIVAIVTPIVDTVLAPIVTPIVTPIVDTVLAPIVTPIVTPIVQTVLAPIVTPIVTPIVAPLAPIVTPIVAPIVAPLAPIVAPIVAPLAPIVTPIVTPIVAPLAPIVTPILAPLAPIIPKLGF